jgi:hypothetical protein
MPVIATIPPSLWVRIMIWGNRTIMIIDGGSVIVINGPTTTASIAFDKRLEKLPHPCRKRRYAGTEVSFERWPQYRIRAGCCRRWHTGHGCAAEMSIDQTSPARRVTGWRWGNLGVWA